MRWPLSYLLDEPFAGVDPISVIDIKRIIEHLRDSELGVLITDHNVRETLAVCERAYIVTGPPYCPRYADAEKSCKTNTLSVYIFEGRLPDSDRVGLCCTLAGENDSEYEAGLQLANSGLASNLAMTPQLQQAIRLLQLSTLELQQEHRQALENNAA